MNAELLVIEPSRAMLSPASHHESPREQPFALPSLNFFRERRALWFTYYPSARSMLPGHGYSLLHLLLRWRQ